MWTVLKRDPQGLPIVMATGRHRDKLVREDGQWRFKSRRGFVDLPATMPV